MSENNGRDDRGRFTKGHCKPGPGRPPRETEADYLAALTELVTAEKWQAIVERASCPLAWLQRVEGWMSGETFLRTKRVTPGIFNFLK